MTILDSSVWIAFFNKEDSQHAKAKKIFAAIDAPIILPEYVILEVASVLAIRVDKGMADQFLDNIENNRDIKILLAEETFFLKIIKAFRGLHTKRLSFVDVSLSVLSKDFPVVTFDNALARTIKKRI